MNKRLKVRLSTMFMILTLLGQSFLPVATVLADELGTESTEVVALSEENPDQVEGEALEFVVPESSEIIEETNDTSEILTEETDETVAPAESSAIDELNTSVGAVNMLVEDDEVDGQAGVSEDKKAIKTAQGTAIKDWGNIFTFESFRKIGPENKPEENPVTDGAIEFNTLYVAQYSWETTGKDIQPGDTAILKLPAIFKEWEKDEQGPLEIKVGSEEGPQTVVGTYTITEGNLIFTFNENMLPGITKGYVGVQLKFDQEKFREDWKQDIDFDADGTKDLSVIAELEEIDSKITKKGKKNSEKDATEIEWTIDIINGSTEDISSGTLSDQLPEGLGKPELVAVKKFMIDFEGHHSGGSLITEGFTGPTITEKEGAFSFEMVFGTVSARSGYQVAYKTKITDYDKAEFTNIAEFKSLTASFPKVEDKVTIGERSKPVQKSGKAKKDTDGNDVIEWTIEVNKAGFEIANAVVKDVLKSELDFKVGSIRVYKYTNDPGWIGEPEEITNLDVTTVPNTLVLGEVKSNESYKITFETKVDWSKVNGGIYQKTENKFENTAELWNDNNQIGEGIAETVTIKRQPIIQKNGYSNLAYDNKTLSWTVTVNEARHPLGDVTLTDILPAGLTIDKSDVLIDGVQIDPANITIIPDSISGATTLEIKLHAVGTNPVKVEYKTTIIDFTENNLIFTNTAKLTGTGIGTSDSTHEVTISPKDNHFAKKFLESGHDYDNKIMKWQLTVDPIREPITSLEINDTFPNKGLIMLPDSLEVKVGKDTIDKSKYVLTPNTETDGETGYHKGFNLVFNDPDLSLNDLMTITYQTSYNPDYVDADDKSLEPNENTEFKYINKAEFTWKTDNRDSITIYKQADHQLRQDAWNSGIKKGKRVSLDGNGQIKDGWVSGTTRKIAWEVYMNYQKQMLESGATVTDTLGYNGSIDAGSIKVQTYKVNPQTGETEPTGDYLSKDEYVVQFFEENGIANERFTLTFKNQITDRYLITYTTSVPDISKKIYENKAIVGTSKGTSEYPGETEKDEKFQSFLDKSVLKDAKTAFKGEELTWKVKVNESLSILDQATITDTMSAGLMYVMDSLVVIADDNTKDGQILEEGKDYTLTLKKNEDNSTSLVVELSNLSQMLTLTYQTIVVADNGIKVSNKVALTGSVSSDKSTEDYNLMVSNFSWVGGEYPPNHEAILIKKGDSSGNTITSDEAKFKLFFDVKNLNGELEKVQFGDTFSTVKGILEIAPLPSSRQYYLQEVKAPSEYILNEDFIPIKTNKKDYKEKGAIPELIKNTRKTYAIGDYTWIDTNRDGIQDSNEPVLPGVIVELYDKDNNQIAKTTTDENGYYIFDELESGDYQVKFILTTEQAKIYEFTGQNTGNNSANDSDADPNTGRTVTIKVHEKNTSLTKDYTTQSFKATEGIDPTWDAGVVVKSKIDVTGTKIWIGGPIEKPTITLQLHRDGVVYGDPVDIVDGVTSYTWENLDGIDENNEAYIYTITEINGPREYDKSEDGLTVTNTYQPSAGASDKIDITGTKVWVGGPKEKPTISLQLYRDNEAFGNPVELVDGVTSYTWENLDSVDSDGTSYIYTIKEVGTPSEYNKIEEGLRVTNTRKTYAIGDYTWIDTNRDGLQDKEEPILSGVIVELYDKEGKKIAKTTTNEKGYYLFDELEAGDYQVKFILTPEQGKIYEFTGQNTGKNSANDSDANPKTGWTVTIKVNEDNKSLTKDYTTQNFKATEGIDPTWDVGVVLKGTAERIDITGTKVWVGGPQVKPTIELQLYRNGEIFGESVTLKNGTTTYTWKDLLKVDANNKEYSYTIKEVDTPSEYNKIEEGLTVTNTRKTYAIGDYTWVDTDRDGFQDPEEPVLPGVMVELYDKDGNKIAETTTDENGYYIFDELESGDYQVKFILTPEQAKIYQFTDQNAGPDNGSDSDANPQTGWTVTIRINEKNQDLTKDYTTQSFKATEGIDPTWDAGVVLKEKVIDSDDENNKPSGEVEGSEDPNKQGAREEEIVKPTNPKKPQAEAGKKIPQLGEELPLSFGLIGLAMVSSAFAIWTFRRRRAKK